MTCIMYCERITSCMTRAGRNACARRTNTAKRAPNMLMHHRHVPVQVDTVSIGALEHSGYGYVNQKKHDCMKKIKNSCKCYRKCYHVNFQKKFHSSSSSSIVSFTPSVSLVGCNSTTKYPVSPAFHRYNISQLLVLPGILLLSTFSPSPLHRFLSRIFSPIVFFFLCFCF